MKRAISIFLSLIIILSAAVMSAPVVFAASYSGTAGDNITWTLDTYSGVITFSGTGEMSDYSPDIQPEWNRYQGYIKSVKIESGVTSIGAYSFYNGGSGYKYKKLTQADAGSSITDIGEYAFRGCSELVSFVNADGVSSIGNYAFRSCSQLADIDLSTVNTIGNGAFSNCSSLEHLNFTETLVSIGAAAFEDCTGLSELYIPMTVRAIGSGAFAGCTGLDTVDYRTNQVTSATASAFCGAGSQNGMSLTFGSYVSTVPKNIFSDCANLTDITLTDNVRTIAANAFRNAGLSAVNIPSGVSSIDPTAFLGCQNLTAFSVDSRSTYYSSNSEGVLLNKSGNSIVRYPSGKQDTSFTVAYPITSIANYAFSESDNLTSVTFASGVAQVSNYAFANCRNLEDANLGTVVTAIGTYSFANCDMLQNIQMSKVTSIGSYAFLGCDSIYSFTSSAVLRTIGSHAFSNCKALTQVNLTEGLTSLGTYAFCNNSALVSAVIPSTLPEISEGSFSFCDSLNSVTITKGVTAIGNRAFLSCPALMSITVPSTVTRIDSYALGYNSSYSPVMNFKIYCTAGSAAYTYVSKVSNFQYEIITDSAEEFSVDDGLSEDEPPVINNINSIIERILNFDITSFINSVWGLISYFIDKISVIF